MKNRILFALLIFMIAEVHAASADFSYSFNDDGTCTLVSARCSGDVQLPPTVSHDGVDYRLTAIGPEAFLDSPMTSISLPSTLCKIGRDAFRRCTFIEKVSVPSLDAWLGIEFSNEYSNPLAGYRPLFVNGAQLTAFKVPDGVTELNAYAFYDCSSLVSVDLSGVRNLGTRAFEGCENLVSVSFSEGLESVADWAFSICCSLEKVSLPATVEDIGIGTFYGCSSLSDITLPPSLKVVPALCFAGCGSLESIDFLPDSLLGIGDYAFNFCNGLVTADIPASVIAMGEFVFSECASLRRATFPLDGVSPGEYTFANDAALTEVTLPENITTVPEGIFLSCPSLRSVAIPGTVEEIAPYAFAGCGSLQYISFPENLLEIGERSFYGCQSLTRLDFPVSMESIKAEAFYLCYSLNQIHLRSEEPFNISFFSFDWRTSREAVVYVPEISVELYREEIYGWGSFDNIIGLPEYNPDTVLTMTWGPATISRSVAYGKEVSLKLSSPDGKVPSVVLFNGEPLEITAEGNVTTPEITSPSILVIEN